MRKPYLILSILSVMCICSCKDKAPEQANPLLAQWNTPFGIPPFDLIKVEHYKPAFEEAMNLHNEEIEAIVSNSDAPGFENVILALDSSGEMLDRIGRIFSLLNSAESSVEMREIEKELMPLLTRHEDEIYLNNRLYQKVHDVYHNRTFLRLDSLQLRLTEKTYKAFIRSGAALEAAQKERLKAINEELASAEVDFYANLIGATNDYAMVVDTVDVSNLSRTMQEAAAAEAEKRGQKGRYAFTLDASSMLPFLTNSDRRDLRETLYTAYLERCAAGSAYDNTQIINDIIRLRTEKAQLLGYESHADYMLEERMAKTPEAVYGLLDGLWTPALGTAGRELEAMKEIRVREEGYYDFASWDWWYYAEKVRKEKYDLNEEQLKPYFSLPNVRDGIFYLTNRLYALTFKPILNLPLYHSDCMAYEVLDANNEHMAVLIMDFYPRPGKSVGAWCGTFRDRTYSDGEKVDPIVSMVCNFTPPSGNRPALLSLDEVETFFHEFGHAIHSFFTDVPYQGLLDTERDFVELPSQIMENWAIEPQMLRRYAMHYNTSVVIPDNLIDKIVESRHFNQGFATVEYLAAAYSDMDIHTLDYYAPMDLAQFEREALNVRRGLIPEIAPRYRYPYYQHIFRHGYSAGYYSYIWSEVLDKDAYEAFLETGDIFNKKIASSFRDNILKKGGSADGMELYNAFRGKEPSSDPLMYSRGFRERPVVVETLPVIAPEDPVEPDTGIENPTDITEV